MYYNYLIFLKISKRKEHFYTELSIYISLEKNEKKKYEKIEPSTNMSQQLTPDQLEQLLRADKPSKDILLKQEHLACKLFLICEKNGSNYTRELKIKISDIGLISVFYNLYNLLINKGGFCETRRYLDIRKEAQRQIFIQGVTKELKFSAEQFSILDGRFFDMKLFSEFLGKRYSFDHTYVSQKFTLRAFVPCQKGNF